MAVAVHCAPSPTPTSQTIQLNQTPKLAITADKIRSEKDGFPPTASVGTAVTSNNGGAVTNEPENVGFVDPEYFNEFFKKISSANYDTPDYVSGVPSQYPSESKENHVNTFFNIDDRNREREALFNEPIGFQNLLETSSSDRVNIEILNLLTNFTINGFIMWSFHVSSTFYN